MRIYIAAAYCRRPQMQAVAAQLTAMGHDVTSTWVTHPSQPATEAAMEPEALETLLAQWSSVNLHDVLRADTVLTFTESRAELAQNPDLLRGGRHVELGIAIAALHRLIVVGPRENVFHFLPSAVLHWYPDWETAHADLRSHVIEHTREEPRWGQCASCRSTLPYRVQHGIAQLDPIDLRRIRAGQVEWMSVLSDLSRPSYR